MTKEELSRMAQQILSSPSPAAELDKVADEKGSEFAKTLAREVNIEKFLHNLESSSANTNIEFDLVNTDDNADKMEKEASEFFDNTNTDIEKVASEEVEYNITDDMFVLDTKTASRTKTNSAGSPLSQRELSRFTKVAAEKDISRKIEKEEKEEKESYLRKIAEFQDMAQDLKDEIAKQCVTPEENRRILYMCKTAELREETIGHIAGAMRYSMFDLSKVAMVDLDVSDNAIVRNSIAKLKAIDDKIKSSL